MCKHKLWELKLLQPVQLRIMAGAFEIIGSRYACEGLETEENKEIDH